MKRFIVLLGACLLLPVAAAEPSASVQAEVQHLLGHLEQSGCQFFRNDNWHSAPEARTHLEKKYRYLLKKGLVSKTEHFIERAATESSISGEAYKVKCADAEAMASAQWLLAELQRYRNAAGAEKP